MNKDELLDSAITMLAEWCVAIEDKGGSWDSWDEYYKDANYRSGPLRDLIDNKKCYIRSRNFIKDLD